MKIITILTFILPIISFSQINYLDSVRVIQVENIILDSIQNDTIRDGYLFEVSLDVNMTNVNLISNIYISSFSTNNNSVNNVYNLILYKNQYLLQNKLGEFVGQVRGNNILLFYQSSLSNISNYKIWSVWIKNKSGVESKKIRIVL